MSSPPSVRKVTCWLSCMPWPRRTSYSRRLGLRSRVRTNRSHPITPEPTPGASALWSRRVRSWKAVTSAPPAGPPGRGSGHWLRSAPPGPAPGQAGRRPAILAVPRGGSGRRDRGGQPGVLPGRQGRDVRGERRGPPGGQGRLLPARAERTPGASRRHGAVSHRGPGPAGTRGPARSARCGDCRGLPRPCRAGSSRANQRSAPAPRTHAPVSG